MIVKAASAIIDTYIPSTCKVIGLKPLIAFMKYNVQPEQAA